MTVHTLPRQAATRLVGLDVARGIAVLLMVLDHVLVQVAPDHLLRLTVTRLSLPMFALLAGALWRPGWRPRYLEVAGAWIVAEVLVRILGMPTPDVLLPLAFGLVLLHVGDRWPWPTLVGLLVLDHVRLGELPGWGGYSLWYVAALVLVGHLARTWVVTVTDRLPDVPLLAFVGRRPLAFYVGHLAVLAAVVLLQQGAREPVLLAPGPLGADVVASRVLASSLLIT